MIRSNKENHVAFNVPRTPMQQKTEMTKPALTNAKTPGAFMTPSRVPLGGKDTNTRFTTAKKTGLQQQQPVHLKPVYTNTSKKQTAALSPAKRTPLSGKLQSKTVNNIDSTPEALAQAESDDDEVESIPVKPPSVPDLPLDHIDMDYDAIGLATRSNFADMPAKNSDLDRPLKELLDKEYALDSGESFRKPKTQTLRTTSPQKSQHIKGQLAPRKKDFMAPTKSQLAKQQHPLMLNKQRGATAGPKFKVARDLPPQVDVDVDCSELESALF